jgi:hypothetical protein
MGKREGYTTQQTLFIAKFEHLKEFKVYLIFSLSRHLIQRIIELMNGISSRPNYSVV